MPSGVEVSRRFKRFHVFGATMGVVAKPWDNMGYRSLWIFDFALVSSSIQMIGRLLILREIPEMNSK
jgi:hypothetical protein